MTDKPWESAVSQVSLAGRTDDIAAMWSPWKAAVAEGGDLDWLRGQLETLIESVADNWQGKDGAMFQQKAQSIGDLIDKIQRNYQTMWTCLNTSRATLTEAKKSIPIPVFGGTYLNGTPTSDHPDPSSPTLDYGLLYRDYQSTTAGQHYTDFKARATTLLAQAATHRGQTVELHGQGWGNASSNIDTDYSINMWAATNQGTPHAMTEDQIKRVAAQAAQDWYDYNAPIATQAMETLRTDYAQQANALPPAVMDRQVAKPTQIGTLPNGQPSVTGSDVQGSGAVAGTSGQGMGASGSGPDWSANSFAGTGKPLTGPGHDSNRTGLSGIGSPTGTSPVGMPGGGSGWGAGGGNGSLGYGGGGGGFGGTLPIPSAASQQGAGGSTEPIGVASDPRSFIGTSGNAGRSASGGLGMMGPGGGAGRERSLDEHHSWLTEEEDIFGARPDDLPPNLT